MPQALTDILLQSTPVPATGRTELADLRCTGLTFRVTDKNARSWSFRFRDPQSGKVTRATIGNYPDVTLKAARTAADRMRRQVASGLNPVTAKRIERREAASKTFDALADRYTAEHAERHKRSHKDDARNLRLHVRPVWGSRRYDSIKRADVIELLEGLVKAGKPSLANKVQALVSVVFTFAVDAGLIGSHPSAGMKRRGAEKVGRRILADDEIKLAWPRLTDDPPGKKRGLALRLGLLTGARPGEIAGLQRQELQSLDRAEHAGWIVPAERSKNGRAHLIPLGKLARETLKAALALIDDDESFIFPARGGGKSITRHALSKAMAGLIEGLDGEDAKSLKADPPTPHDLRRTVATRLSSLGVTKQDRDAVLNHTPTDVGSKHYDLYEREREKRRALNLWDGALGRLLAPSSKVVGIASARSHAKA